jgi:hypothetical protein
VGVRGRIQCTVIGDTVNSASRIEQLTKTYGASLLVGERTVDRFARPGRFTLRAVDLVAVKGKTKAFQVFEVLDAEPEERRAAKLATAELLDLTCRAYRAGHIKAAHAAVLEALAIDPDDAVLSLYARRCEALVGRTLPEGWDGVESY